MKALYNAELGGDIDEREHRIVNSVVPIIFVMFMLVLATFGLLGNCAIILVMTKRSRERSLSTNFYETLTVVQAVSDIICVIIYSIQLVARQGYDLEIVAGVWMGCKFLSATFYMSYGISSEVLVLVSTARYIAVYYPYSYYRVLTSKIFFIVLGIITMLSIITFINFSLLYTTHIENNNGTMHYYCGSNSEVVFVKHFPQIYFGFVHVFVPAVYIIVLVFLSSYKRSKLSDGGGGTAEKHVRSLTLLNNNNIAVISLVQGLPVSILYILVDLKALPFSDMTSRTVMDGGMAMALFPKGMSFLILYLYSPRFRKSFDKIMGLHLIDFLSNICLHLALIARDGIISTYTVSRKLCRNIYIHCYQAFLMCIFALHIRNELKMWKTHDSPYHSWSIDNL